MSRPTMYLDAAIYAAEDPFATALLVQDGQIAWMGTDAAARTLLGPAMDEVRLDGALIAPAFVDSHVHLTETGRALASLDVSGARGAAEVLDAVAVAARGAVADEGARVILGHGWDESAWQDQTLPTPHELSRAAGGREVYLSRVDVHAGLASLGLFASAGLDPNDALSEVDHARLREVALASSPTDPARWHGVALKAFAAAGYAAVAEMAAPHVSGEADVHALLARGVDGGAGDPATEPRVYAYWGQLVSSAGEGQTLLQNFGGQLAGLGGDLSVDGSLGARTAALLAPYADAPGTRGELLLDARAIADHVMACHGAGTQAAFHAIGDAAVREVLDGYELAAAAVGEREFLRGRHRLEHVEGIDSAGIQRMLRLGLSASVQPGFDAAWGGPGRLYEQRLGTERAAALNPFGSLSAAGVPLALGSDAPVTAANPWASIRACLEHTNPAESIPARAAFLAHTRAGYRAVREPHPLAGTLRWGAPATFAVWEASQMVVQAPSADAASFSTDARARTPMLPDLSAGQPRCLRTVRDGVVLHDTGELGA